MPIFNKIRKDQIKTDGLKRYLLYAVGEIVLVVVGILIALEINNWNEHQIEIQQERLLMANLNHEFKINNELLKKHRAQYHEISRSINWLMSLMGSLKAKLQRTKPTA